MLQRWKCILSNWNNCYFNEDIKHERTIDDESLINIISHLRENLNFDESKSSVLEAFTIKEFILEKYPAFKFENGTVEPSNEDEVYHVASLLLFFVCLNSKDVDIKNAMCSKLSSDDQETILKFSKSLMECSEVTLRDVQTAITEACGQDAAPMETPKVVKVAETPPVLRSLHGEVRRLQAALDAERFDRNFLQDELGRTNAKLEKLLKDKEQYKLDIVNLKSKVSLCRGEEANAKNTDNVTDQTNKLTKQLQQLEEKLVDTQSQVEDLVYERDVYKAKVNELKQERDKLLTLTQQETARVSQVTEDLEVERHQNQALKDLVTELRQHNKLNRLDSSSLLECDDPDASIQSLPHNSSICTEACANVIEVQLEEERANIRLLKEQIESLQEKIASLNQKAESEKKSYEAIISEGESNIFTLKHRINEEIEKNNNLKVLYDNEVTRLNNEINELEQHIKSNNEHSRSVIEQKLEEIQKLQEEKLSLLHSLNNETTKLDKIIKDLTGELETEKQAKSKLRENYENHIMKLNEKVLNRNNELVELQNTIFEKGEKIETLQIELKKEKEIKEDIVRKYNDLSEQRAAAENVIQQKCEEVNDFKLKLQNNNKVINDLQTNVYDLNTTISELNEKCQTLEVTKDKLIFDLQNSSSKVEELTENIETITKTFTKQIDTLTVDLDERIATVNSLRTQLENEIQYKVELQNELQTIKLSHQQQVDKVEMLCTDLSKMKEDIECKDKAIDAMDLCIQEEKKINENINETVKKLSTIISDKDDMIKDLDEKLKNNETNIEELEAKLQTELSEKEMLQLQLQSMNDKNAECEKEISQKYDQIEILQKEVEDLSHKLGETDILINYIKQQLEIDFKKSCEQFEERFSSQMSKIETRFHYMTDIVDKNTEIIKKRVLEKETLIQALTTELDNNKKLTEITKNDLTNVMKEKESLLEKLNVLEEVNQNQCNDFEKLSTRSNNDLEMLIKVLYEDSEDLKIMEDKLKIRDSHSGSDLTFELVTKIKQLKNKMIELGSLNEELEQELQKEIGEKMRIIPALQQENEQLQYTIEEDNSNHEVMIREKDSIINKLEEQMKENAIEYKKLQDTCDNYKLETENKIKEKEEEIVAKNNKVSDLERQVIELHTMKSELNQKICDLEIYKTEIENQLVEEKGLRDTLETEKEQIIKVLLMEKESLVTEKAILTQVISEEKVCKMMVEDEKNVLLNEKIIIKDNLKKDMETITSLQKDNESLSTQLAEEKQAKELIERDIESLAAEKAALLQKLHETEQSKSELLKELTTLTEQHEEEQSKLNDRNVILLEHLSSLEEDITKLNDDLKLERSHYSHLLEGNQNLSVLNISLQQKLEEVEAMKNTLIEEKNALIAEKDNLELSLSDEKSSRDELETEKCELKDKINELNENLFELKATYSEAKEKIGSLEEQLHDTVKELCSKEEVIQELLDSKNSLLKENDSLVEEKEALIVSLNVEKSVRDEIETEKHNLIEELKCKQDDAQKIESEITELKANQDHLEETNLRIMTNLNSGINNLIEKFKSDNFDNVALQKIIEDNPGDNVTLTDKCSMIVQIADILTVEVENLKKLENALKCENSCIDELKGLLKQKDTELFELQTELKKMEEVIYEKNIENTKQSESYTSSMNAKIKDIQTLQQENKTLNNELNDVKLQLEVKVHSLKEKLVDNENLTDKLKTTYESQIDNLNLMVTKLTNYLKEKTVELESLRKDKEQLTHTLEDNREVIKSLEEEVKVEKQNVEKIVLEFESERQVLKNMVTVTESVMDDQKASFNSAIADHLKAKQALQEQNDELQKFIKDNDMRYSAMELANISILTLLRNERLLKEQVEIESELLREYLDEFAKNLTEVISLNATLRSQREDMVMELEKYKTELETLQTCKKEIETVKNKLENEIKEETQKLLKINEEKSRLEHEVQNNAQNFAEIKEEVKELKEQLNVIIKEKDQLEIEKNKCIDNLQEVAKSNEDKFNEVIEKLNGDNKQLGSALEESKTVVTNLEQLIKHELEQNDKLRDNDSERITLLNKYAKLQSSKDDAEKLILEKEQEITLLRTEIDSLKTLAEQFEQESKAKDGLISKMSKEKDAIITSIGKELVEERAVREKCEKELEGQKVLVQELKNSMEMKALRKENDQLLRAIGQQETFAALCREKAAGEKYSCPEPRDHQVDNSSSDTHSSVESLKTITDLEKIIHDKNRTITTLQSDITYLKSLMAESETKLLDVNKDLEMSQENCQQLSSQLKKLAYQKNEEISDLKRQLNKMSVTESRASQIIKVSAKYQAMILRRIAEIKTNTILKELTNFGNTNGDTEFRRSLNAGTITIEELENFLESTDRQLKRCADRQLLLQKERDRLHELNKINETEVLNLRKFLNELTLGYQTFETMRGLYGQKLSRGVAAQRAVRRELLDLEGRLSAEVATKLERGYSAVMQDLAEATLAVERWAARCVARLLAAEKIKRALTGDDERTSLAPPAFQHAGLEVQLDELEKSFQKLLEEAARAIKAEGGVVPSSATVMEVRAEYEDKLNRMKAKMKELFNEQMAVFKEKQREEIAVLERELQKTRDKMEDSKQMYEKHIRDLTKELWNVGERYLMKNDETEYLKKKQRSGSLMSLQHVHSSGLMPPQELPSRPSDTSSLRSLPVTNNPNKHERTRTLQVYEEEGEVFDNRCLRELASTPRAAPRAAPGDQRLSELRWRNSLCLPHLKSSYPAETQFAPAIDEDEIKAGAGVGKQRKEVGITAYKKPGPPTPSKQAGRLSATDSELRESLRVEADPLAERKTSTPARLRAFLGLRRNDTNDGTPRARRLSSIFRRKQ